MLGVMIVRLEIRGAELCVDEIGDPSDPAVLLVMGAAGSMDRWEDGFCERLAAEGGLRVIRYDHRDTGGSTTYPPGEPGYDGDDLVEDPVAILDALGIERAHVIGLSMGGALAQRIAVEHPERVRSLALLSTSSAGSGGPDLPGMSEELRALFAGDGMPPEPDWDEREATIAYLLEGERPYAGARGIDEAATRELLGRVYDRSSCLPSANNHYMVDGTDMPHARLAEIAVPTLVIHGTHDPLFPTAHGEALAEAIPGAQLRIVDGLGHELPRWAWNEVLPPLIELTTTTP
jgi:pimeloyl-ACP methyl ester carboxylesterase